MQTQPRYKTGDKIGGRYQVYQALMGGMGEVYLCLDQEFQAPIVLKTFQQRFLTSLKDRKAFEREVATWIALGKHPNIVRCHQLDWLDSRPFMFLDWIVGDERRGADLSRWLRHGALDLELALTFAMDVCRGLIHADRKQPGIVHRDLKPANILVAQGNVAKITDFGLAKIVQEAKWDPGHTDAADGRQNLREREIAGTPLYMAPEQWCGQELDMRTDIYAIGCILYEMLSGRPAFMPTATQNCRQQHLQAPIPKLPPDKAFPPTLDSLLARCLAKRKDERWASVEDLLQELLTLYRQYLGREPRLIQSDLALNAWDYVNSGLTHCRLRLYGKALADLDTAIKLDPELASAYHSRGLVYKMRGDFNDALRDFAQALRLAPNVAETYNDRGNVFYDLGQLDKALNDYNRALELDPGMAKVYNNRGLVYTQRKQYDRALVEFDQTIKLDTSYDDAFYNRGLTHAILGHHAKAVSDFSQAIALNPAPQAFFWRGASYLELEQYQNALDDCNRVIELDLNEDTQYLEPSSPYKRNVDVQLDPNLYVYLFRGDAYYSLERYEEAQRDYEHVIRLAPTLAPAHRMLGFTFIERGDFKQALPHLERAAGFGDVQARQALDQTRYTYEVASALHVTPKQLQFALEAIQATASLDAMRRVARQHTFIATPAYTQAFEKFIAEHVPLASRQFFQIRLTWLCQIVNEQQ